MSGVQWPQLQPSPVPVVCTLCADVLSDDTSVHFPCCQQHLHITCLVRFPLLVQFGVPHRFTDQLYADDLVVTAECQHDLQVALDAVSAWRHQWRFSFWIGPTKSAIMVFGIRRGVPPYSAFLSGQELPLVSEYPYLGVILTPSLSWTAHARPCLPWQPLVRSVRCLMQVRTSPAAVRVYPLHVLRAAEHILGVEFLVHLRPLCRRLTQRYAGGAGSSWVGLQVLPSVNLELGWLDAAHISTSRLLSHFGRMHTMLAGDRCLLPALVVNSLFWVPKSWVGHCVSICGSLCVHLQGHCGVGAGCSQCAVVVLALAPLTSVSMDVHHQLWPR